MTFSRFRGADGFSTLPCRYATELVVREERAMQLVQDMLLHQRDQSERNGVAAEARLAVSVRPISHTSP